MSPRKPPRKPHAPVAPATNPETDDRAAADDRDYAARASADRARGSLFAASAATHSARHAIRKLLAVTAAIGELAEELRTLEDCLVRYGNGSDDLDKAVRAYTDVAYASYREREARRG